MLSRQSPITLAACLTAAVGVANAQKPITDCDNVAFTGGYSSWLTADCPADDGTTLSSAVFLPNQITNDDGYLKWKKDGNYAGSCEDCSLDNNATLSCTCWSNGSGRRDSSLDLTEHISLYSGLLLSDFLHEPTLPATISKDPVPQDPSWAFHLGSQSCHYEGPSPPDDLGCDFPPVETPSGCSDSPTMSSDGGPLTCDNFREPTPMEIYLTFQAIDVRAPGGAKWEVTLYSDLDCAGEPLIVLSPEELGSCTALEEYAVSWSVRPTWNADY